MMGAVIAYISAESKRNFTKHRAKKATTGI